MHRSSLSFQFWITRPLIYLSFASGDVRIVCSMCMFCCSLFSNCLIILLTEIIYVLPIEFHNLTMEGNGLYLNFTDPVDKVVKRRFKKFLANCYIIILQYFCFVKIIFHLLVPTYCFSLIRCHTFICYFHNLPT